MNAVVQRVRRSSVYIDRQPFADIGQGMLVLVGVAKGDTEEDAAKLGRKALKMRIFADDAGKMNRSVIDVGGAVLLVSNFTLHGDCRKGRRPGFDAAAAPELAEKLYEKVAALIAQQNVPVEKGAFGAYMQVTSTNDGPVTFLLDSARLF